MIRLGWPGLYLVIAIISTASADAQTFCRSEQRGNQTFTDCK
jgi:hypothetical protein